MNRPHRLIDKDRPLIERFLRDKMDVYVFVAERLLKHPSEESIALAILDGDSISSMLYLSGNVVPISLSPDTAEIFTKTAYVKYAQIASIVGIDQDVNCFWKALSVSDESRSIQNLRAYQPYMVLDETRELPSNPTLRYIELYDFEQYFDASYSMFIGEVGRAPINLDNYKSRLYEQIMKKRCIGYFDEYGTLRFKVDIPICYENVCQVQGVWLHPEWRGKAKSSALFAEAISVIQRDIAPRITLYVNDFNIPALKLYQSLGFKEIARYSTIFLDL
ncbi:MAG: GNAT family N-acetyltransferase [Candidatus Nanopelagicales bacterium]